MKAAAERNMEHLLAMPRETILEGDIKTRNTSDDVLVYATREVEAWKHENDDDIAYALSLDEKAESCLAKLQKKLAGGKDELSKRLAGLKEEGLLNDDDLSLLQVKMNWRWRESPAEIILQKETKDVESVRLRALVLQESFNVGLEESMRIADVISDEDIDRVYRAMNAASIPSTSRALLAANPTLFMLEEKQLQRYTQLYRDVAQRSETYDLDEFKPEKSPANFCSFEALYITKRKLEFLISEVRQQNEETADLGIILKNAEDRGMDAEMTLAIINGFWFSGSLFQGKHRLSEANHERNVTRIMAMKDAKSQKRFAETRKQLIQEGVILNKGGMSLNPHLNEIENPELRKLLLYARQHRPSEYL